MPEREYEINTRGHVWKRDANGEIDEFGYDDDNHNGPCCVACGYGFCHHCHSGPQIDCDIVIDGIIIVDVPEIPRTSTVTDGKAP